MELDLVSKSMSEFELKEGVHFEDKACITFNQSISEIMQEIICVVTWL